MPTVSGPFGLLETSGAVRALPELLPGESLEFTETIDGVAATAAGFTRSPGLIASLTFAATLPWLLFALPAGSYGILGHEHARPVLTGWAQLWREYQKRWPEVPELDTDQSDA